MVDRSCAAITAIGAYIAEEGQLFTLPFVGIGPSERQTRISGANANRAQLFHASAGSVWFLIRH